jgi:uncharacterized protein YjeT (DUF2065 family)
MGGMKPMLGLGMVFLIGGLLNILFADEYVRYVTNLYSAKTVRITGWVAIVVATVLIGASLWAKMSQEFFS